MPMTVLDKARVDAMRLAFIQNPDIDRRALAEMYGITTTHLHQVLMGYAWKDRNYTPPRVIRRSRLTWTEVRVIRRMRLEGHTLKVIAELFGVTTVAIHHICHGNSWKNDPVDGIALPIVPIFGRVATREEAA